VLSDRVLDVTPHDVAIQCRVTAVQLALTDGKRVVPREVGIVIVLDLDLLA
jgi:hypothetical protein